MATEGYDVETEDGYVLKLFRIPGYGKPVLLQHGFMDSADGYILRGRTSLPAILVQAGYDVWLGNFRGNKHSRRHLTLNPDSDDEFWDFTLQEFAFYDLPAIIDFILYQTGRRKLSYIGHSQGTTTMFILGAIRPEYNDKIDLFIALCPVVYLQDVSAALKFYISVGEILNNALKSLHMEELFGPYSVETRYMKELCGTPEGGSLCLNVGVYPVAGHNPSEIERSFILSFYSHFPSGSSRKVFHHFMQIGQSGHFGPYNSSDSKNLSYRTLPFYDLRKVTMPTILVNSMNDGFSSIKDTNRIKMNLPNVLDHVVVKPPMFNHIDFLLGRTAYKVIYGKILKMLSLYNSNFYK
ncbi:alpha/beta hydrolase fold domain-containing protein [Phthorimaea operculella]|nr:alpha/beta hydrolase fold domain-containing protein [Phthorimaea operculella]